MLAKKQGSDCPPQTEKDKVPLSKHMVQPQDILLSIALFQAWIFCYLCYYKLKFLVLLLGYSVADLVFMENVSWAEEDVPVQHV